MGPAPSRRGSFGLEWARPRLTGVAAAAASMRPCLQRRAPVGRRRLAGRRRGGGVGPACQRGGPGPGGGGSGRGGDGVGQSAWSAGGPGGFDCHVGPTRGRPVRVVWFQRRGARVLPVQRFPTEECSAAHGLAPCSLYDSSSVLNRDGLAYDWLHSCGSMENW